MIDPKGLQRAVAGGKRLLIYLHDNPDPDAIAAAWLLADIGQSQGLAVQMLHGGSLGRAENRAMVRLLDIPLGQAPSRQPKPASSDRFALVDTQPGAGNNAFPAGVAAHVVFDHHPARDDLKAEFVDVRSDSGCTSTMLLGYHQAFGLTPSPALATAAYYAVISETQDLRREATKADREACLRLFPLVQLSTLGRIRHPPRERDYYRTIARAMRQVEVGKNTCVCHVGEVNRSETVAELADFLVAMRNISWCLVTGLVDGNMPLSIRSTHEGGSAHAVIQHLVAKSGSGGGHDMMAGGVIPCADLATYRAIVPALSEAFLERLSRRTSETLRPLLEQGDGNVDGVGHDGLESS